MNAATRTAARIVIRDMGVARHSLPARVRAALAVPVLLATLAVAGCGSSHGSASSSGGTHSTPAPSTIRLTPSDDGGTARASVGDTLMLRLPSTYWHIAAAHPTDVVATDARHTRASGPGHDCVPGQGCGVASAKYTALRPGRAVISAHRTSCGEALRCTGATSRYRVTVVVRTP